MSHDPIHDWLDMAFRKLGGEKNAYQKYKRHQDYERRQREEERERRRQSSVPDISFDPMATMAGGFAQDPTLYGPSDSYIAPFSSGHINSYGASGSPSSGNFISEGRGSFEPSSGQSRSRSTSRGINFYQPGGLSGGSLTSEGPSPYMSSGELFGGEFATEGLNSHVGSHNLPGGRFTSRHRNSMGRSSGESGISRAFGTSSRLSGILTNRLGRSFSRPVSPPMSGRFTSSRPPYSSYMSGAWNPDESAGSQPSGSYESHGRYYPYGSDTGSLASERSRASVSPAQSYSVSEASSGRQSPIYPHVQRLIEGPQSSTSSPTRRSSASPRHSQVSKVVSLNQDLVPYGQRGDGSNSTIRNRRDTSNAAQRTPTAQSPLGDMTRSYLEGMVPNSEADSFRRRHRHGGRRG